MRHNSGLREDDRQETEGQRQPPEAEILLGLEVDHGGAGAT